MKSKFFTGITLAFLLATLSVAPVFAEDWIPTTPWQPNAAFFQGIGWVTSYTGPGYEGDQLSKGDKCVFQISGNKLFSKWSGRGIWVDKDWSEGPVTAVLTVNNGLLQHDVNLGHITEIFVLFGYAKVYLGSAYKGTYGLEIALADSAKSNLIDGQTPDPMMNPDWLHFTLTDLNTKLVYYDAAGRLGGMWPGGGNIWTLWYPTYSGT